MIDSFLDLPFYLGLLFPLDRIQTNMQIKATYASDEVKHCKEFFSMRQLYL